jgi:S-adenosylmethionine decarboxylase
MEYSTYGRHIVVDLWGVDFALLNNIDFLQEIMRVAGEKCLATVLSVVYEKFDPYGGTVIIILSESHLSIHTYPEKGFAAIDCYTCGKKTDPNKAINYLIDMLKPKDTYTKTFIRGLHKIEVMD